MSLKSDELLKSLLDVQGPFGFARLAAEHESAIQTAATAALVVRPTVTAAITLWNGENLGGKSLLIDRIFTHNLVSTAIKTYFGLWYCMHLDMAKPTNDITALRGTGDGREADNSMVVVDVAATVLNDGWFPCGREGSISETASTPQGIAEWECRGRLIVPPRHGISVQVVASLAADTFTSGLSWWRTQL